MRGRVPVLVGIGTSGARHEDPALAPDAIGLMIEAAFAAGADSGAAGLLARVDEVVVPRGSWQIADPARHVAAAIGVPHARSVLGDLGVLQHTLIADACTAVAHGGADVVLVVGAEARFRDQQALRAGIELPMRAGGDEGTPDVHLRPAHNVLHTVEMEARVYQAVVHYALLEDACRRAGHQSDLRAIWRDAAASSSGNPQAWRRDAPMDRPTDERMLSTPYTRGDVTQWNVDQGAALLITSTETADVLGVRSDRRVFPLAAAESNHMVPLVARPGLATCPALRVIGHELEVALGRPLTSVDLLDLYSCFPVAIAMARRELGVRVDVPHTVTGGMALAGGPFNNYVLQSTARMAQLLRSDAAATGLVTCLSGMLTKQGAMVWSATPTAAFTSTDVTAEVARLTVALDVAPLTDELPPDVEAETLEWGPDGPLRRVAIGTASDGRRVLCVAPVT